MRTRIRIDSSNSEFFNDNGRMKRVSTYEEAVKLMQYYSPIKTQGLQEQHKSSCYVVSLIVMGIVGLILVLVDKLFPLHPILMVVLFFSPAPFVIIREIRQAKADRKKNEEILSGAYFSGKSEASIISEANYEYAAYYNNLLGLAERFNLE